MNFSKFFDQYETLVRQIDAAFDKVQGQYPQCVRCRSGCADCCHALFDLTLVEAIYIKSKFDAEVPEALNTEIVEAANKADRAINKIKRQAARDHKEGKSESGILKEMAEKRIRCPLLDASDRCRMYKVRPITCRIYGIPTQIGEMAHSCSLSGFKGGERYPTVKLDQIQSKLYEISSALAREINSRYIRLAELLVPLSMALLTDYNPEYLGVKKEAEINAEKNIDERAN